MKSRTKNRLEKKIMYRSSELVKETEYEMALEKDRRKAQKKSAMFLKQLPL